MNIFPKQRIDAPFSYRSVSILVPPTLASVCGKTIVWRSLPTTRVTALPHPMSRSTTTSVLLVMPPRTRSP